MATPLSLDHVTLILDMLIRHDSSSGVSNIPLIEDIQKLCEGKELAIHTPEHGAGSLYTLQFPNVAKNPDKVRIQVQEGEGKGAHHRNLIISVGPKEGPGIILSGHSDTVPTLAEDWDSVKGVPQEHVPWVPHANQNGDGLIGLGAVDMKDKVAMILALLDYLVQLELKIGVHIMISFDEEVGSSGIQLLTKEMDQILPSYKKCWALVLEPTELEICYTHKGYHFGEIIASGEREECFAMDMLVFLRDMKRRFIQNGPFDESFNCSYPTVNYGLNPTRGESLNTIESHEEISFVLDDIGFLTELRDLQHRLEENLHDELKRVLIYQHDMIEQGKTSGQVINPAVTVAARLEISDEIGDAGYHGWFEFSGVGGHSGRPQWIVNPMDAVIECMQYFREMGIKYSFGRTQDFGQLVQYEYRSLPDLEGDRVVDEIYEHAQKLAELYDVSMEFHRLEDLPSFKNDPGHDVNKMLEGISPRPKLHTKGGWTEAPFFQHVLGIPTAVFGHGEIKRGRAHKHNEVCYYEDLKQGYETFVKLADRLAESNSLEDLVQQRQSQYA